jgi:hypothetical protein
MPATSALIERYNGVIGFFSSTSRIVYSIDPEWYSERSLMSVENLTKSPIFLGLQWML